MLSALRWASHGDTVSDQPLRSWNKGGYRTDCHIRIMKRLKTILKKDKLARGSGGLRDGTSFNIRAEPSKTATGSVDVESRVSSDQRSSYRAQAEPSHPSSSSNKLDNEPQSSRQGNTNTPLTVGAKINSWPNEESSNDELPIGPFELGHIAGSARIPDEDLLAAHLGVDSRERGLSTNPQSGMEHEKTVKEPKRRKRREAHNPVERRRRDNINESIQTLSALAPTYRKEFPSKQTILEAAVNWTRDLMWAMKLKTERESKWQKMIRDLGGVPLLPDTLDIVEESIIDREVKLALEANDIDSFSSTRQKSDRNVNPYHVRQASEPLQRQSIHDDRPQSSRHPRQLHKVTSRGSIISYVASVHSVTSLTYRSPIGNVETETQHVTSTFSYFPDQQHASPNIANPLKPNDFDQLDESAKFDASKSTTPSDMDVQLELAARDAVHGSAMSPELIRDITKNVIKQFDLGSSSKPTPNALTRSDDGTQMEIPVKETSTSTNQFSKASSNIDNRIHDEAEQASSLPPPYVNNGDQRDGMASYFTRLADEVIMHVENLEKDNARLQVEVQSLQARSFEQEAVLAQSAKPVKLKDAIGRTLNFPFHLCRRWKVLTHLCDSRPKLYPLIFFS